MADNIKVPPGADSDPAVATDEVASVHYQKVKIDGGGDGASVPIVAGQQAMAASLPVVLASDQSAIPVTGAGGTQYTEDAAAAADPIGNALIMVRDDALSGQTTTDGDNVAARGTDKGELYVKHVDAIPVTDNAGSLTVDNAALSVVGGGVEATALRVTIASDSTGVVSVDDNGASLTVDNAALSVTGGGVEATALRVTIASDSTGVLSVDDNGGSLTVDVGAALPAGDNNIGNVDLASAIPAGTNHIGTVGAIGESSSMRDAGTSVTPKFAIIDAATSGDNTLVAAVASKKIRVIALFLVSSGTVNVRFESGAGGTALSGQMNLVANTGFALPYNPVGWFQTAVNTLLNLELSGAVSVDGSLTYIEVD